MAFTHKVNRGVNIGARGFSYEKQYSADGVESREIAVPGSETDLLVNIAIDYSELKNLFLAADQDLTIETNNPTTPDDTINLKANSPMIWNAEAYFACPFSADVTKFYVTNGETEAATLIIEVLQDATP